MINTEYLKEFHEYWNLSKPPINTSPIKNKINYYFGVELKHLTKENIQSEKNFIQIILAHSKPSELEKDVKRETELLFA